MFRSLSVRLYAGSAINLMHSIDEIVDRNNVYKFAYSTLLGNAFEDVPNGELAMENFDPAKDLERDIQSMFLTDYYVRETSSKRKAVIEENAVQYHNAKRLMLAKGASYRALLMDLMFRLTRTYSRGGQGGLAWKMHLEFVNRARRAFQEIGPDADG